MRGGHGRQVGVKRKAHSLRPAFADEHQPDAFQEFDRRVCALWQEKIGVSFAGAEFRMSRKKDRRGEGGDFLRAADQFVSVDLGHHQVGEQKIDPTLAEDLKRLPSIMTCNNAIPASLEHHFSNGEGLFIVVDAKDGALRFHWGNANLNGLRAQSVITFVVCFEPERS